MSTEGKTVVLSLPLATNRMTCDLMSIGPAYASCSRAQRLSGTRRTPGSYGFTVEAKPHGGAWHGSFVVRLKTG